MKEFATPATNEISKLQQNQFLRPISIKNPNMKLSATLVIIVNIDQDQHLIFRNMFQLFIKVVNVITKKLLQVI